MSRTKNGNRKLDAYCLLVFVSSFVFLLLLMLSLLGEFWLGLENIHSVARNGGYILNVRLSDWGDDLVSVSFPFLLGGEETKYSLRVQEVGTFSTLESSLGTDAIAGLPFSTSDRDNDRKVDINCAKHLSGERKR